MIAINWKRGALVTSLGFGLAWFAVGVARAQAAPHVLEVSGAGDGQILEIERPRPPYGPKGPRGPKKMEAASLKN
ncbi:MAG: hypothetical protein JWN70_4953 [Planctomycetaceae bacterium]|nr:hypothetical protein [Planctomycetaceae bacterium]